MSVFVFSVLCYLTPELALLSTQSVFLSQLAMDTYYTPWNGFCSNRRIKNNNKHYDSVDYGQRHPLLKGRDEEEESKIEFIANRFCFKVRQILGEILDNKLTKVTALILQVIGAGGLLGILILSCKSQQSYLLVPVIALPLSIITLAFLWNNKFQDEFVSTPARDTSVAVDSEGGPGTVSSTRHKASESLLHPCFEMALVYDCIYCTIRIRHL